jgi:hypothetical protein
MTFGQSLSQRRRSERVFSFIFALMKCQPASKPELFEMSTGKKLDDLWAEFVATQTK